MLCGSHIQCGQHMLQGRTCCVVSTCCTAAHVLWSHMQHGRHMLSVTHIACTHISTNRRFFSQTVTIVLRISLQCVLMICTSRSSASIQRLNLASCSLRSLLLQAQRLPPPPLDYVQWNMKNRQMRRDYVGLCTVDFRDKALFIGNMKNPLDVFQ